MTVEWGQHLPPRDREEPCGFILGLGRWSSERAPESSWPFVIATTFFLILWDNKMAALWVRTVAAGESTVCRRSFGRFFVWGRLSFGWLHCGSGCFIIIVILFEGSSFPSFRLPVRAGWLLLVCGTLSLCCDTCRVRRSRARSSLVDSTAGAGTRVI